MTKVRLAGQVTVFLEKDVEMSAEELAELRKVFRRGDDAEIDSWIAGWLNPVDDAHMADELEDGQAYILDEDGKRKEDLHVPERRVS